MAENTSDHDLLRRARGGERGACESLLQRHRTRLEAWLSTRIGLRLKERLPVEDVIQETFSKVIESLDSFEHRGEGSFFRWLCSVGKRVILKAAEQDRRKPLLTLRHETAAREDTPSKAMRRDERFDRLERALDGLTREQREVVLLARIEGLPITEIARRTGR